MDLSQTFYRCTRGTFHNDECNGECGEYELSDTDKELYYESKRWEMSGMAFEGVPSVLKDGPFGGIIVDSLDVLMKIQCLVLLLVDKGLITQDEYNDALGQHVLKRMTILRQTAEKARAKQRLVVAQSKLLGPNGQPLQ